MRKTIIGPQTHPAATPATEWLDLSQIAEVELTSEDPSYPMEAAFEARGRGWRAAGPGPQTIRLLFHAPIRIRKIRLRFQEDELTRTQEFLLRYSADSDGYRDIVRQQYNFSPPGTSIEMEEYSVELSAVTTLELTIIPDIGGGTGRAQLSEFRIQ